ncbi:MAG: tRNA (N(6)-L-threonylcarbamoyladenosine(37)-C(2))-methylthiotransferase MtaB [Bacteroidales bacterium]
MQNLSFSIINLGCKLNFAEASTIARHLSKLGFSPAKSQADADICIINTCAVTENSEKKCRQTIRKVAKESNSIICATGCYTSLNNLLKEQMPELHIVAEKSLVVKKIQAYLNKTECTSAPDIFFEAHSSGDRTRTFLKIQDGCDYHCSYCTVPLARGASRSNSIERVIKQAKEVIREGTKEIVLTGVNIGDFGRTTGETFLQLLQALSKIEGIERYRISSIEPNLLTDEIINFVARMPQFLPHFHIPLQSPNNRILGLMSRRYTCEFFAKKFDAIRQKIPLAFIGIDIIVGFPTETDEEFEEGIQFLEALQPAYLHVFPYSQRPNTIAAKMPQIHSKIITERTKRLSNLCEQFHLSFLKKNIGRTEKVLFESSKKKNLMFGFTKNYVKVGVPYTPQLANKIAKVKLLEALPMGYMTAELLEIIE